jgi:hypothetical protein
MKKRTTIGRWGRAKPRMTKECSLTCITADNYGGSSRVREVRRERSCCSLVGRGRGRVLRYLDERVVGGIY